MTTTTLARCDYCASDVPADQTFVPYRGAVRCRDVPSCERRQLRRYDPSLIRDEDKPQPPATGAPAGAACAICGVSGPGLYERLPGQWLCWDTARCQQQSVDLQFLHAWSDSSPDRLISSTEMRAMAAAAPTEVPPERTELSPAEMAALASQEALGRKRQQ